MTISIFTEKTVLSNIPRMMAAAAFLISSWPSLDLASARLLIADRMAAKMLTEMASGLENADEDEEDWDDG
jgi:hypothetical protein